VGFAGEASSSCPPRPLKGIAHAADFKTTRGLTNYSISAAIEMQVNTKNLHRPKHKLGSYRCRANSENAQKTVPPMKLHQYNHNQNSGQTLLGLSLLRKF
jgi:hypothetical protein